MIIFYIDLRCDGYAQRYPFTNTAQGKRKLSHESIER